MALKPLRWLEKVNAAEKYGVDFFICGVLTEMEIDPKIDRNFAKIGQNPAQNYHDCAEIAIKVSFTSPQNAAQTDESVQFSLKFLNFIL